MNLANALGLKLDEVKVILIGNPEETTYVDSDEQPYYSVRLKSPITVRCSVDPEVLPHEVEEVFIRKEAITMEGWTFANGKDATEGYFMPNWVVDFSKSQQLAIYQETSIRKWSKSNRTARKASNLESINTGLRAKMAAKAGGK